MVQHFTKSFLTAAIVAAAAFAANSASAAVVEPSQGYAVHRYDDVETECYIITNITEVSGWTNPDQPNGSITPTASGVYGQPIINEDGCLYFDTEGYVAQSSGGNTQSLYGKLSFDVIYKGQEGVIPTVTVKEGGLFSGSNGGSATVSFGLIVTKLNSADIIASDTGVVTPDRPFIGPNPGQQDKIWSLEANAAPETTYTAFSVQIDNELTAWSLANVIASRGFIDKKFIEICIPCDDGGGEIPEPASLGVLGLGAMALLARRRK